MSFVMPIVVRHEMRLSESIASDCCYSVRSTNLTTSKIVHNGGNIVEYTTWPLKAEVSALYATLADLPKYHYYVYVLNLNQGSVQMNDASYMAPHSGFTCYKALQLKYGAGGALDSFITSEDPTQVQPAIPGETYVEQAGGLCNHGNDGCWFVTKTTIKDAHVGSVMGHPFGGSSWMAPHQAQQFNS